MSTCENDYYLDQYERDQETLENEWLLDLPEKREAVSELAKEILDSDISDRRFREAFEDYLDDEFLTGVNPILILAINTMAMGGKYPTPYSLNAAKQIVTKAMRYAVRELYPDVSDMDELLEDGYSFKTWRDEVMKGGN